MKDGLETIVAPRCFPPRETLDGLKKRPFKKLLLQPIKYLVPRNICPYVVVTESPMAIIARPKPMVLNHGLKGVVIKLDLFNQP